MKLFPERCAQFVYHPKVIKIGIGLFFFTALLATLGGARSAENATIDSYCKPPNNCSSNAPLAHEAEKAGYGVFFGVIIIGVAVVVCAGFVVSRLFGGARTEEQSPYDSLQTTDDEFSSKSTTLDM